MTTDTQDCLLKLILTRKNGTCIAGSYRLTYCSSSEIPGMLVFIWNARKCLSQPVEALDSPAPPTHYGNTATNSLPKLYKMTKIMHTSFIKRHALVIK